MKLRLAEIMATSAHPNRSPARGGGNCLEFRVSSFGPYRLETYHKLTKIVVSVPNYKAKNNHSPVRLMSEIAGTLKTVFKVWILCARSER